MNDLEDWRMNDLKVWPMNDLEDWLTSDLKAWVVNDLEVWLVGVLARLGKLLNVPNSMICIVVVLEQAKTKI